VIDGPDACGKSTQVGLLAERLKQDRISATCVHDPGGTPAGERIRELLLDSALPDMEPVTEMLLYMASRAELVARVIRPALESGHVVISSRFVSSTIAYQGFAGGIDPKDIEHVAKIACGDVWPDLVVILDLAPKEGFERSNRQLLFGWAPNDRMELKGLDFHERVATGFRQLARRDPEHYVVVDGRGSVDKVGDRVWKAVQRVLR